MKRADIIAGTDYAMAAPNRSWGEPKRVTVVDTTPRTRRIRSPGGWGTVTGANRDGIEVRRYDYDGKPHSDTTLVPVRHILHTWEEEEARRAQATEAKQRAEARDLEAARRTLAEFKAVARIYGVTTRFTPEPGQPAGRMVNELAHLLDLTERRDTRWVASERIRAVRDFLDEHGIEVRDDAPHYELAVGRCNVTWTAAKAIKLAHAHAAWLV